MGFGRMSAYPPAATEIADHFLRSPRPSNTCRVHGPTRRLRGSAAYKHSAEHFAVAPDDFAPLAYKCMRHGRKFKRASNCDIDLSDELRAIQRHIQDLALVADKVIVEREPCGLLPRSSRFTLLLCNKHQNILAWYCEVFPAQKRQNTTRASTLSLPLRFSLTSRAKRMRIESRHRFVRWRLF
jgi:hypothetical protein